MRFNKTDLGKLLSALAFLLIFNLFAVEQESQAQQMVVDDATINYTKPFEIQGWYGTEEAWFQPGILLGSAWEFSPGVIFDTSGDIKLTNYVGEIKFIPGDIDFDGYAYGWVGALVFDDRGGIEGLYTFIPYSQTILNETSLLHVNVGLEGVRDDDWSYSFTTGIRGDFGLSSRITLLSEVYTSNFEIPDFQGGFRFSIVPDTFEIDITGGTDLGDGLSRSRFDAGYINAGFSVAF